jgi:hypothetical protein
MSIGYFFGAARRMEQNSTRKALERHFGKEAVTTLVTAGRTFPITSRVDVQLALEALFAKDYSARLIGVHSHFTPETMSIASLISSEMPSMVGPLQYDDVDTGDDVPVRCLKHGLWLGSHKGLTYAALLTEASRFAGIPGVHVEVAVPPGEVGLEFSRAFLQTLEEKVQKTGTYRGKVISLEASDAYSGAGGGSVRVHRLRQVAREEVVLPLRTLQLLENNVHSFIQARPRLRQLGMPVKKGLLFYGPPGTGKTHTLHYLAAALADHTTLLITAEQMGLLDHYFQLARFLQPAIVVIEDADLIARAREQMGGPCEESLLNRLLNEMDGLREDAEIIFILTTNRPEQLEGALTSRPGRIDQAIEFPLPDDEGRHKLVRLYSRGLPVSSELGDLIVRRTEGASPAFIKELMRRSAQALEDGATLEKQHVEAAFEEILFAGGSLNAKLLGAPGKAWLTASAGNEIPQ